MILGYDQWRNFRFLGSFDGYFPSFPPDLLHFSPFEVGKPPKVFVRGKVQCFVLFLKVNLHKILPDGGICFWADWTVNWHVGARRGGSRLCRYTI